MVQMLLNLMCRVAGTGVLRVSGRVLGRSIAGTSAFTSAGVFALLTGIF
jgi:hypothetical protein